MEEYYTRGNVSYEEKCCLCTIALLLVSGSVVSAHPGRTDANGGHTCRTNCERWGLSYGEYHYHNGGGSSSGDKSSSSTPKAKSSKNGTTKSATPKPAAPAYAKSGLKVFVNGGVVKFGSEPLVYNNVNLVPRGKSLKEWELRLPGIAKRPALACKEAIIK